MKTYLPKPPVHGETVTFQIFIEFEKVSRITRKFDLSDRRTKSSK